MEFNDMNDYSDSEQNFDDNQEFDDDDIKSQAITNLDDGEPVEQFDFDQLPIHACSYCGIHHIEEVIKCTSKGCNKWFCNGKGKGQMGSHIILHLVKAKHKEIQLHPDSQHGETPLECYVCGNKNIFLLGFVPIQSSEEQQVIMICRLPCLNTKTFNNLQWDPADWTALVEEKMIVNWLVKPPSERDMRKGRQISIEQINQIEEMRKNNQNVDLNQIDLKNKKPKLNDLLLKYEDGKHYCDIMMPLIELEAQYDKQIKESQTQSGIQVRWEMSLKKKRLAYFIFTSRDEFDSNLMPGNELKLSLKSHNWSATGHVIKINSNDEVCLELHGGTPPPHNLTLGYTVEFVWKSTSFGRMKVGLKKFYKDQNSISSYLYYRLLGFDIEAPIFDIDFPKIFSAPNLPELNYYQIEAVKKALKTPLCLIQGPPGTGKTVTSASIVYHLVKQIQNMKKGKGQILVCAPSNIVVDQLAEKIHNTGTKVVRICSKSREAVSSNVEFLTLHSQVRSLDIPEYSKLQLLFQLLEDQQELNTRDENDFKNLIQKAEAEILASADVICATCIAAAGLQQYMLK